MEENQVINEVNEINEEVVNTVCNDMQASEGSVLGKVVIIAGVAIVTALVYKAYKKKKGYCEIATTEVINEPNVVDNNDNE